jgi:hypothetical protein
MKDRINNHKAISHSWCKGFLIVFILFLSPQLCFSDDTNLLRDGQWINRIRKDHPRMFLNQDMLPSLRMEVKGRYRKLFEDMRTQVNALPVDAPVILKTELFTVLPNGKINFKKASQKGETLFKYNGSEQAVKAALLYLITQEKQYLEKAKNYLKLSNHVLKWTSEHNIWMDHTGNTRVNALTAYDWIYNDITPNERKEILMPMLAYITEAQPKGSFKFRRSMGGPTNGNYGELPLEWFAGLVAYEDGIDNTKAEGMLRRGAALFVDMMDHREKISAGSGLLSTATVSYSFGVYPYSTFNFLHTWKSAFNQDLSERWKQMLDYPNWFDWAAIKLTPDGNMLYHGIGDLAHANNLLGIAEMYTNLAQTIHFYGKNHPDKIARAYETQLRLPEKRRAVQQGQFPFLPFLLNNFDPAGAAKTKPAKVSSPRYFFNPSFGLLFMRSGIGETDTYASFRFGSSQVNHQHYDELSFVIYKHNFLALDAGSRTETAHHHNFAAQSVAHNTLLIHEPKELVPYFWRPWGFKPDGKTYYNHGGQLYKDRAKSIALQSTEDFIYAAGDATKSYAEVKSKAVTRQFVYLKPNLFVIYDRVTSVKDNQAKEFLLHFQNEPVKLDAETWRSDHEGRLFVRTLLPEKAAFNIVGGPGREFEASGRNWELPGGNDWEKQMKLTGKWRLEVSASTPNVHTAFLHVLQAGSGAEKQMIATKLRKSADCDIVEFTDLSGTRWELEFNRTGELGLKVKQVSSKGKVVFDAALPNVIEKK